ncbi:MAG: MerR family transcriptional regulator, copper efflux regulator, partial [Solirubrobacteraceae bacterium]|nr:MerR family transcriptional regulator, copper efflux regulator [Solirubrobacteraceae bacterium]
LVLGDVGLALRLRREPELRRAVDAWLDSTPARPADVAAADWLSWEQAKHQSLMKSFTPQNKESA